MRYNGLSLLNPLFLTTVVPSGDGTAYPVSMLASEIAFWFLRVATINITGSMSDPGTSYPSTPNNTDMTGKDLTGTSFVTDSEDGSWIKGTRFSCSVPDPTESPVLVVDINNAQYFNSGVDDSKNWFASILVSKLVTSGGLPMFTTNNSLSLPTTGVSVTFSATDLAAEKTYTNVLQTYGSATASGSFTITPKTYFPFHDAEGVALYDIVTGAFV